MAKLGNPYPFPIMKVYTQEEFGEQDKALDNIPSDRIFDYPVADGKALYYVESFSPLVIRHIDDSDGWSLPDTHIRGLKKEDVIKRIEGRKLLNKFF